MLETGHHFEDSAGQGRPADRSGARQALAEAAFVRLLAALDPEAPARVIDRLTRDPAPAVQSTAATAPQISPGRLPELLAGPGGRERCHEAGPAHPHHAPHPRLRPLRRQRRAPALIEVGGRTRSVVRRFLAPLRRAAPRPGHRGSSRTPPSTRGPDRPRGPAARSAGAFPCRAPNGRAPGRRRPGTAPGASGQSVPNGRRMTRNTVPGPSSAQDAYLTDVPVQPARREALRRDAAQVIAQRTTPTSSRTPATR